MDELVRQWTSLPSLHPALVHFPLALVPAALALDIAGLVRPSRAWLVRAAGVLWVAAGLGAGAAYWAGREAAEALGPLPPQIEQAVGRHSDAAWVALWVVGIVAAARLVWEWWRGERAQRWVGALFAAAGAVTLGVLGWAADLGGALVYEHGVGVRALQASGREVMEPPAAEAAPAPDEALADTRARLQRLDDGSLLWRPAPGDGAALGSLLELVGATVPDAVAFAAEAAEGGEGLPVEVRGRAWLVLQESFEDVQVEAELDLVDYEGRIGLVHHVREAGEAGFFDLHTDGTARLGRREGGRERVLDRAKVDWEAGRVRLAVSAVGRHLKGYVDGKTVVHGHAAPPRPGKCGLLFDGRGLVRVRELRITPTRGEREH